MLKTRADCRNIDHASDSVVAFKMLSTTGEINSALEKETTAESNGIAGTVECTVRLNTEDEIAIALMMQTSLLRDAIIN